MLLQWSPATFWAATPHEFWASMEIRDEQARAQQLAVKGGH